MITDLLYSLLLFFQSNWKLLVPLYLAVSLALVLFILFISIKSKENGTLYITAKSPFFYLRYISYLILLFPLEGITVLKKAKAKAESPVSLCVSFWTATFSFSIFLLPSLALGLFVISLVSLVTSFLYIVRIPFGLIDKLIQKRKKARTTLVLPKVEDKHRNINAVLISNKVYNIQEESKRIDILAENIRDALAMYKQISPDIYPFNIESIIHKIVSLNKTLSSKSKKISEYAISGIVSSELATDNGDKYEPESFIDSKYNEDKAILQILLGKDKYDKLADKLISMSYQKQYQISQKILDNLVQEELDEIHQNRTKEAEEEYDHEYGDYISIPRPTYEDIYSGDLSVRILYSDQGQAIIKNIYKIIKPYLTEAYVNVYNRNKKILGQLSKEVNKYSKEFEKNRREEEKRKKEEAKEMNERFLEETRKERAEAHTRNLRKQKVLTLYKTIKGIVCPTIQVQKR